MARSISNVKIFSAVIADGFSNAINRRGFAAAASQGAMSSSPRATRPTGMVKKSLEEKVGSTADKVSWIPDPITGYYRPENQSEELDVADLRAMLLKKN